MQLQCQFDSILRKISAHIVIDGDDIRLSGQYLRQYTAQSSQSKCVYSFNNEFRYVLKLILQLFVKILPDDLMK